MNILTIKEKMFQKMQIPSTLWTAASFVSVSIMEEFSKIHINNLQPHMVNSVVSRIFSASRSMPERVSLCEVQCESIYYSILGILAHQLHCVLLSMNLSLCTTVLVLNNMGLRTILQYIQYIYFKYIRFVSIQSCKFKLCIKLKYCIKHLWLRHSFNPLFGTR